MTSRLKHFSLLVNCSEEELICICQKRKIAMPLRWQERADGFHSLIKSMVHHLEDYKYLSDAIAGLHEEDLRALKSLCKDGLQPSEASIQNLFALGLILRMNPNDSEAWTVADRTKDALEDFDDAALTIRSPENITLLEVAPYQFALGLIAILIRCVYGIRILKGGLPAKKEILEIVQHNALFASGHEGEQDASLLFTLLHRLGFLWQREGRVETLVPAVLSHPSRWVTERSFSFLIEHDLDAWEMPCSEDRLFFIQHLADRPQQTLKRDEFLNFLSTLRSFDKQLIGDHFIPFLLRVGLLQTDPTQKHLRLSDHGLALALEYIHRDQGATQSHWALLEKSEPLIVQPNLQILTPLLQNPHRLLRLAEISQLESIDTLITFSVTHASLVNAIDAGLSIEEIRTILGNDIPATVLNLLDDLERRVGEIEVKQGLRILETRSEMLANELMLRPELRHLRLSRLSPTIIKVDGEGDLNMFLKASGYLPKPTRFLPLSIDASEEIYLWSLAGLAFIDERGINHHLDPIRQMIRQSLQKIRDDAPSIYQQIQRRIPMLHLLGEQQPLEETRGILDYAISHQLAVEITYLPPAAHRTQLRRVSPRNLDEEGLLAFCHLHQEEMRFGLKRIEGVKLLSEKAWNQGSNQVG